MPKPIPNSVEKKNVCMGEAHLTIMLKQDLFKRIVTVLIATAFVVGPLPSSFAATSISLSARSVYLFDVQASRALFSKAAHVKRPPASTVKILTALVVLDHLLLDAVVSASRLAASRPSTNISMQPGERFVVRDLLVALLVGSANDVATTLAEGVAGSEADFSRLMNQKARDLGALNSKFLNPHGLPAEGQYSTAHDLAQIMKAATEQPLLVKIMSTRTDKITSLDGRKISIKNHNKMMWRDARPLYGKTGWTRKSRHCFTGFIEYGKKKLLIVTMGSVKPWTDLKKLLDFSFGPTMQDRIKRNKALLSKHYVKEMQAILSKKGFDPGPIDGAVGKRTVKAIMAFQRAHDLKADGIVGPLTQAKLESTRNR